MTHPSPPECIFRTLLSAVHPQKQRHLIKVHFAAKSFIHYIFRMCSVRQKKKKKVQPLLAATPGHTFRGSAVIPRLSLSVSHSLIQQCVGTHYKTKQTGPSTHMPFITLCVCVWAGKCVSLCVLLSLWQSL